MVADRPYRAALPHDVALAELERCAGTQFDPVVVAAFREALAELADADELPRAA
jgi:HD-GYP domain-containing protein (c-di-GMP phosphodiesterase class II)